MLGFVQGKVISVNPEALECIVQAGDVGYELRLTRRAMDQTVLGESKAFWIHTHVREDILLLYGFLNEMEKQFFRVLINVQGLGPKTALALLSEHGVEKLTQLIINKDITEIATAPGVGKKLAERLILELASKIEKLAWLSHIQKAMSEPRTLTLSPKKQLREDLVSALTNLGYQPAHIKMVLDKLLDAEEAETKGFEALLRTALGDMSGRPRAASPEVTGHG